MNLYSTETSSFFLNRSYQTPAVSEGGCRMVEFAGRLYCVYVDGTHELGPVKFMSRSLGSEWSEPLSVFSELRSRQTPHIFVFNARLHVLAVSELGVAVLATFDAVTGRFVTQDDVTLPSNMLMTPTSALHRGTLYLFFVWGDGYVMFVSTADLKHWSVMRSVTEVGIPVRTNMSPVALSYQGLIHIVYKAKKGGFYLIKSDGEDNTRPQLLVADDYNHSPGVAIHNGMLTLVFGSRADALGDLYHYRYDGNVIGQPMRSSVLAATDSPGAAILESRMVLVYRGKP